MRQVYIQYCRPLRPSPLWRSGTSFASHAMGLRFESGPVRSCIFAFFSCGSDCGLRPFKMEFWSVIQEIHNQNLQISGVQVILQIYQN